MMLNLRCCKAISLSFLIPFTANAEPPADPYLDRFINSQPSASVQRLSITASLLRDVTNLGSQSRERWDILKQGNLGGPKTLNSIFAEYQYRLSRDQSDAFHYNTANTILIGGVIVGGVFVPGGTVPAVMWGLGSAGASAGISSAFDELKSHGQTQTSRWLENALTEHAKEGKLINLVPLKNDSPKQRLDWLRSEGIVDELLAKTTDVRPEDRPIIEGMLVRTLNDRINRSLDIQKDRDADQDAEIAKQAEQIGAVARTLNEFKEDTENKLQDISNKQTDLANRVNALANDVNRTHNDIAFLQKFMFEKMSPSEQLAALRSGVFSGLSEGERQRQIAKIEIVERRQALINDIEDFSQGASTIARIATRLKVDENVVSTINKGAEIAKVAQIAMTGFMSGGMGYLAAADAISGLAFGPGSDPGAERHQQVMQALAEIKAGIVEIQGMLVEMKQQLDQIQQLQMETYKSIERVSQQIQANHREVMAELARIRADLVPIAAVANEILFKNIEACNTFQERLRQEGFTRHHAIPYAVLRSIHRQHGRQCLRGLKDILRDPFISTTYDLRRFKGDPGSPADLFIERVYTPTRTYFDQEILPSRASIYAKSFGMPVSNLNALNLKRSQLFGSNPPAYTTSLSKRSESDIIRLIDIILSPQAIARHIDFLLFAHPFFEIDEALAQTSPTQLLSLETTDIEGRELLRSALFLVEVAIAQQTMLAGDAVLDDLDHIWRDGILPKKSEESNDNYARRLAAWERLKGVIIENHALRRNLILWSVSTAVRNSGNLLVYGAAYNLAGDPSYLRTLLPDAQFNLVWRAPEVGQSPRPDHLDPTKSTGWHLRLADKEYPLPTPIELASGDLVQTPDLKGLLDLKNKLLAELYGYLTVEKLSAAQQQVLRQGIWRVADHYHQ
jgi:hypothetical protein